MNDTQLASPLLSRLVEREFPVQQRPVCDDNRSFLGKATGIVALAWAVRLVSLLNLVDAFFHHQSQVIYWLGSWVPFEISEGYRLRMVLTSILLLTLASGLERGKRLAWQLTIGALMIVPMVHIGRSAVWPHAAINLFLVVFLLYHHHHFTVRSDARTVKSVLSICSFLIFGLIVLGATRLYSLQKHSVRDFTIVGCVQTAGELVLPHVTPVFQHLTPQSAQFYASLRTASTSILLVGLILILRPTLARQIASPKERDRARRLIELHGDDPLNSYALLEDKSYFFANSQQAVVPYVLSGNIAVALVDPVGLPHYKPTAVNEFIRFCRQQDWEPVFYAATEDMRFAYERAGLALFKIGEGARIRANEFQLKGGDFQNLRTIRNKAHRQGITFRWYDAREGIDHLAERQLVSISDRWLATKNATEMAFDMGQFSIEEVRRNGAGIAVDPSGVFLAFATWRPFARNKGRTLDLMRHISEARNVMDFTLIESIFRFRAMGIHDVSLGLAPLANVTKDCGPQLAEDQAVRFIFENCNWVYGYKSLFDFKRKYRPHWKGRYVAYRRGTHLPSVALALARVHSPRGILAFFKC